MQKLPSSSKLSWKMRGRTMNRSLNTSNQDSTILRNTRRWGNKTIWFRWTWVKNSKKTVTFSSRSKTSTKLFRSTKRLWLFSGTSTQSHTIIWKMKIWSICPFPYPKDVKNSKKNTRPIWWLFIWTFVHVWPRPTKKKMRYTVLRKPLKSNKQRRLIIKRLKLTCNSLIERVQISKWGSFSWTNAIQFQKILRLCRRCIKLRDKTTRRGLNKSNGSSLCLIKIVKTTLPIRKSQSRRKRRWKY